MAIERLQGESDFDFHKRLVYGKLIDKTLVDEDYSEIAPLIYGKEYSSDVARRMMYGSCKTLQLLDECGEQAAKSSGESIIDEIEQKKIELQKERQRFFDQRSAFNKAVREQAREEELNDILEKAISEGNLPSLDYEPASKVSFISDTDMLVTLNDIHYGAFVSNYWNNYSPEECRKMMKSYLDKIIDIQLVHHCERCIVFCGGDQISGNIHYSIAVTNKENVIDQIKGVSELISEFLAVLSEHFTSVVFTSVSGNHSRLNPNKDMTRYDERLDDLVEWYLAARLSGISNIVIDSDGRIDPTMCLIDIRGKLYCGVHGDYDGSEAKVRALQAMVGDPLYAIISGHLHHNAINEVQGVKTVMAGSFLGMDDYCVSKRIYGKPQQLVCICNDDGIACYYDVNLK